MLIVSTVGTIRKTVGAISTAGQPHRSPDIYFHCSTTCRALQGISLVHAFVTLFLKRGESGAHSTVFIVPLLSMPPKPYGTFYERWYRIQAFPSTHRGRKYWNPLEMTDASRSAYSSTTRRILSGARLYLSPSVLLPMVFQWFPLYLYYNF
jgi:hypothetical protein